MHWGSFEATGDDIARWKREGRTDILMYLETTSKNMNDQSGVFVTSSCPFLARNEGCGFYCCTINDTKPFHCKNYPADMVCEYTTDVV